MSNLPNSPQQPGPPRPVFDVRTSGAGLLDVPALAPLLEIRRWCVWSWRPVSRKDGTVRWTKHPPRALVAELGSAFLRADLELAPEVRDDHVSYIASWPEALKNDRRCIVLAASYARKAVDFLHSFQSEDKAEAA